MLCHLYFSDYSSSLSPRFGRLRADFVQAAGMSNLSLYFAYSGRLFSFNEPYLMDVSFQLSPVNFPAESYSLPSLGIELTLCGYRSIPTPLSTVPCVLEDICA